ncbi:MAG: dTMP kinase [Longimicrobiaceae bacterium]
MADTPHPDAAARRGRFIVLEGIDGAGTTTQLNRLREHFLARGERAFFTHEPSDGPVGMLIRLALQGRLAGGRYALHDPGDEAHAPSAEFDRTALALLFAADRADHVATQVKPNLAAGRIVVCDRYLLSTLAYQGQSCDVGWLLEINRPAVTPDLTLFLDLPPSAAEERMRASRWKKEMFETPHEQESIRDAYLRYIAMDIPQVGNVKTIDASRPADVVFAEIVACVDDFLNG